MIGIRGHRREKNVDVFHGVGLFLVGGWFR